jgi:hypothetical protein
MYLNELIEALNGYGLIIDDMPDVERRIEELDTDPEVWVSEDGEDEES